jgi:hypothetical protein
MRTILSGRQVILTEVKIYCMKRIKERGQGVKVPRGQGERIKRKVKGERRELQF